MKKVITQEEQEEYYPSHAAVRPNVESVACRVGSNEPLIRGLKNREKSFRKWQKNPEPTYSPVPRTDCLALFRSISITPIALGLQEVCDSWTIDEILDRSVYFDLSWLTDCFRSSVEALIRQELLISEDVDVKEYAVMKSLEDFRGFYDVHRVFRPLSEDGWGLDTEKRKDYQLGQCISELVTAVKVEGLSSYSNAYDFYDFTEVALDIKRGNLSMDDFEKSWDAFICDGRIGSFIERRDNDLKKEEAEQYILTSDSFDSDQEKVDVSGEKVDASNSVINISTEEQKCRDEYRDKVVAFKDFLSHNGDDDFVADALAFVGGITDSTIACRYFDSVRQTVAKLASS